MAKPEKLQAYEDLNQIEDYCERFHLDPDFVYLNKSFDDVMVWAYKWKEQREFEERCQNVERMMENSGKK
jgi:hypothetical protein